MYSPPEDAAVRLPLREGHKQLTRDRITRAAQDLFAAQGFRATIVSQIADMAGTTSTTFYRHFKSKDELAWLLKEQLTGEMNGLVTELDGMGPWTLPLVRQWLDSYFTTWLRIHKLCEAFWEATYIDASLASDTIPATRNLIAGMTRLLSRFEDSAAQERAKTRLAMLLLSLDRVAYLVQAEDQPSQQSPLLDEFAVVLWRALTPDVDGGRS